MQSNFDIGFENAHGMGMHGYEILSHISQIKSNSFKICIKEKKIELIIWILKLILKKRELN